MSDDRVVERNVMSNQPSPEDGRGVSACASLRAWFIVHNIGELREVTLPTAIVLDALDEAAELHATIARLRVVVEAARRADTEYEGFGDAALDLRAALDALSTGKETEDG